jgi:3D (Asp-Asp-Asp) domain-containing protein
MKSHQLLTLGFSLVAVGCAQNSQKQHRLAGLSKESTPRLRSVRTTAYCPGETGRHVGARSAVDQQLQSGQINSAAADWSRFPYGTKFRIVENNRTYVVDDYGSALVGTNTIDLFMSTQRQMRQWGVRHVTIELIESGSHDKSLLILRPRRRVPFVRRMINQLEQKTSDSGES